MPCGSSHNDRIKGGFIGQAEVTVSLDNSNVVVAEMVQTLSRTRSKSFNYLYGVNLGQDYS